MSAAALQQVTATLEQRLVGRSRAMRRLRERIAGLAPLWTPVLVVGEPGSGRDTVARALHELGATAGGRLRHIAGEELASRPAAPLPAAIYLDGIESLPRDAQAWWAERLAWAEERCFAEPPRVLASASSGWLADGPRSFHPSLFACLRRFHLETPPLRERREDIPELVARLLEARSRTLGRRVRLGPAALRRLAAWSWPGNVRELEHLLERAIAFSPTESIDRRHVDEVLAESRESVARVRQHRSWREREELLRAIHATGGNISHAAARLGTSRSAVYRRIEKHGIELHAVRQGASAQR